MELTASTKRDNEMTPARFLQILSAGFLCFGIFSMVWCALNRNVTGFALCVLIVTASLISLIRVTRQVKDEDDDHLL